MRWLFVLFVALPLLDLWLLLSIGGVLGFWPTLGLTLAVAVLGAYLAKREGLKVLRQWRDAMSQMRMPEEGLVSAALVLAGAVLLATPGVLTDVVGLVLLVPVSRRPIARLVRHALEGRVQRAVEQGRIQVNVVDFGGATRARPEPHGEVIDAEAEVVEEAPKALPAHQKS
jgi:UPF0716 protein FxsA